ncbi:AB hydrolase-1 domain-containing protein [Psidium guajava]|nr:AB hydrolase-1 domain-containing protein [Psidium guajava]
MSIEALAMAGVDHAEYGIKRQTFGMDSEPPSPHLLDEENDALNSVVDARDYCRRRSLGIDEDWRMKLKIIGWVKYVTSMHGIPLKLKRKEVHLDEKYSLSLDDFGGFL